MSGGQVGTSGWPYKGWAGAFYPPGLQAKGHFSYYATKFQTVEINATFYRLPTEKAVRGWATEAPDGFIFAVKGSRFITHMKKLKVQQQNVDIFSQRIRPLKKHLGPILWQLPPNLRKDIPRLENFIRLLPHGFRHAVEFRHPSWVDEETKDLLRGNNMALVSVSSQRMPMDRAITSDFIYLRFHGLEGGAAHNYTAEELKPWANHCRTALRKGLTVYACFNNDANVRAPKNALELVELIKHSSRKSGKSVVEAQLAA